MLKRFWTCMSQIRFISSIVRHRPRFNLLNTICARFPTGKASPTNTSLFFFDGNNLVAVLDLIEKYPDKQTVFIGLFMVAAAYQGRGVGSKIVSSCFKQLAAEGYTHVRLGYVKTNPQAKSFWQKLGLVPTGIECEQEYYTVVVTDRII